MKKNTSKPARTKKYTPGNAWVGRMSESYKVRVCDSPSISGDDIPVVIKITKRKH